MSDNPYQRWFFCGAYTVAGRPKMEEALMHYTRANYYECLVYESFLPKIVKEIQEYQDILYEKNKRLKKVDIRLTEDNGSNTRWLRIGVQNFSIRRVKEEIEYP